jgi:predicted RNase H-like nuclease (RuvC/YqgF family)
MNFDDTSTEASLRAEIAELREQLDQQRAWIRRMARSAEVIKSLDASIARLTTQVQELRQTPASLSRIAWIKARHAAVLGGGITLGQLTLRRKAGLFGPEGVGWRKINARTIEYREDIVLSAFLAK